LNYLAHGYRFLDRPRFVAGTALPDWLGAADRRSRLRGAAVEGVAGELAAGVRQHLADDTWFHATAAFQRSEGELTELVRGANRDEPRQRAWFFGHVLVEMLLDAWLMEEDPRRLDDYYEALAQVGIDSLVAEATPWLTRPPERLHRFVGIFLSSRFLEGYRTDEGVLERMNGVARRVGLPSLSADTLSVLPEARRIVYGRATDLLSEDQ
jgi:hypothetical protein